MGDPPTCVGALYALTALRMIFSFFTLSFMCSLSSSMLGSRPRLSSNWRLAVFSLLIISIM